MKRYVPCVNRFCAPPTVDFSEVVWAEGAAAESFHPGEEGFDALGIKAQTQILAIFPQLMLDGLDGYGPSARRSLRAHEADLLQMYLPAARPAMRKAG